MHESAIEQLAKAIEQATEQFTKTFTLYGADDRQTSRANAYRQGLEDAFQIVSGQRYFDYWMENAEHEGKNK